MLYAEHTTTSCKCKYRELCIQFYWYKLFQCN
nr:MAG TPA: hypothetical protein [Caudoviricetes sp.]